MNNASIIFKKAGHLVDDRYLLKALKEFPSAVGTVVRVGDDLSVTNHRGVPDLETMMKALEAAKEHDVWLWLANIHEQTASKQDDIQPFLLKEGDKNILAVMLEGDFPDYSDPKDKTDEWANFAKEIVFPTLNDYAEQTSGDFEKFLGKLNGKLFEKTMLAHVGHRGNLVIIPCAGDALSLSQNNDLLGVYDWGSTTNSLDFDPKAVEEQEIKEEPEKKSGGFFNFGSKKAKAEDKPVEIKPTETPKKEEPTVDPAAPTLPDGTPIKGKFVAVPKNLKGNSRKKHIRKLLGLPSNSDLPEGWFRDDFRAFLPDSPSMLKDMKEIGKAMAEKSKTESAVKGNVGSYPEKNQSDLPVISDKAKADVLDFVTKRLDANANQLGDPTKMQELESKVPSFSEATAVSLHDLCKLRYTDLRDLADTYPVEFALAMKEFGKAYLQDHPEVKIEPQKIEEPAPAVEEPKKVASGGGSFSFFGKKK